MGNGGKEIALPRAKLRSKSRAKTLWLPLEGQVNLLRSDFSWKEKRQNILKKKNIFTIATRGENEGKWTARPTIHVLSLSFSLFFFKRKKEHFFSSAHTVLVFRPFRDVYRFAFVLCVCVCVCFISLDFLLFLFFFHRQRGFVEESPEETRRPARQCFEGAPIAVFMVSNSITKSFF